MGMPAVMQKSAVFPSKRLSAPLFIGNEIYRHSDFGPKHPLSVPRVPATIDLSRVVAGRGISGKRTGQSRRNNPVS